VQGKEADARSDIFAFGAVLYEMATGKRPFSGKSQISLASSILESDPQPIGATQPLIPRGFEHVVATCLQKDPDERFQTAHDIKLELQWVAADRSTTTAAAVPAAAAPKHERLGWAAVVVVAIALGAIGGILLHRTVPPAPSIRTLVNPPEKTTLNLTGDSAGPPVLSPDGSTLAFAAAGADGKTMLWVRPMNSLDSRMLADTDGATFPFWSADSRSIAFFAQGKMKSIDITGGSALVICDAPLGRGGTAAPGGVILFSPNVDSPIMRISATGDSPVPVTKLNTEAHTSHRWPFFLPDGKHFLYLAIHHDPSKAGNDTLSYASLDGRENRALFRSQSNAIYANGYLLFARADQLMAQAFDPASGALSGNAQIVARGIMNDSSTWHVDASASDNGLLVYGSGSTGDLQLVWMDRATQKISVLADKIPDLAGGRISPQGDRIALQIDTGASDIWVLDIARGVRTRLTFGPVANLYPVWSPDGQWIAYVSVRNAQYGLYRKRSDGSGAEEVLMLGGPQAIESDSWSQDGKYLLYTQSAPDGTVEVWALPLEGERKPFKVVTHGAVGQISPDGGWLTYRSTESGNAEVYVVPFRSGQGKWQVSATGGNQPQWSRDGKELYYIDPTYSLFAVPVKEVGGALQFGTAQKLVSNWSAPNVFYDLTPDGKKILLDRYSQQVNQSVTVVTNFTADLKKQ